MISYESFGKVKLLDLFCDEDFIELKILDCTTNKEGIVRVSIRDANPKVLFIHWKDIEGFVKCDINITQTNDSLLDFEF